MAIFYNKNCLYKCKGILKKKKIGDKSKLRQKNRKNWGKFLGENKQNRIIHHNQSFGC